MRNKITKSKKILAYLVLTFLSVLPHIEVMAGMSQDTIGSNENILIIIDSILAIIVISVLFILYKKLNKKHNNQKIVKSALITMIMLIISIVLNIMFSSLPSPSNQVYIDKTLVVAPILTNLQTRVFSPIIEELLTRGIFMNLFFTKEETKSIFLRIFFSGLFFGLSHGLVPSVSMIFYCGMGWILSYTYYSCNNKIVYPILIHMIINNL
ncbi:CPBP family intramembrane glutamic endopeptidase [Enterococcus faecalis]|uniref:CPBP family intramembrane glutamic endopeptidase n=1 Tax=Enterococcus faecalis TaxID=1351 RepID=UPI003CC68EFB